MTYRFCVDNLSIHWFLLLLSLGGSLASSFQFHGGVPMSVVLGESLFCKFLSSFQHYSIVFVDQLYDCNDSKRLDPHSPVSKWFKLFVAFFVAPHSSLSALADVGPLDIHGSNDFVSVCDCFSQVGTDSLSVYMDGSLKNLGMIGCRARTAAFFENINLGLDISVQDLVSSTLTELQAIALALKCVSAAHSVHLFLDSQAALNACRLEFDLVCLDFYNWCWHKIKSHSGVLENDYANSFANTVSFSGWYLPLCISEYFLLVDGSVVSGNSRHFVYDVFCVISSGSGFLDGDLHSDVNWLCSSRIWHPNLHMATGFTSRLTLSVAVWKCIYNKCYSSVLCLYCGKVEVSNHVFFYMVDDSACHQILESCMSLWRVLFGLSLPSLGVLQLLSTCALDFPLFSALYKSFEAIFIFHDPKVAGVKIANFVQSICLAFRNDIWLVCAKHHIFMEKNSLIPVDSSIFILVSGLVSGFLAGIIKLLGIAKAFGVCFGFCKSCSFFSGIGNLVSVNISV
ncbi:hypothetical protein G9A89_022161 [Geosiphon pyriformis]|nr:hypothetical protein G9A89_022161 [Geosiphon pyriformis]